MNKTAALVLLLLGSIRASADTAAHPVSLWMVEGVSNRIYLLGSVHMLRKGDYPLPSVIGSAYEDAESLIMEIDMDDLDAAAAQALVTELGVLNGDTTLRDLMGSELYDRAAASAQALEIPFDMLTKTEPWLAAITIEQLVLNRAGFNPLYGVEMHFMGKAQQDGKEIVGFETIQEQLGFLDNLSLAAQRDLLMQTLDESVDIEQVMNGLIDAWRNGDVQFLEKNMLADMLQYPELYSAIVVNRNRRWTDNIATLLNNNDDYLIIVGALHLIGDDGVPAMLSRSGARVVQMHQSN